VTGVCRARNQDERVEEAVALAGVFALVFHQV